MEKVLKIKLVKSPIACPKNQRLTVKALGLTKLGQTKELPDNACIQGSIFKVKHLVKVEKA